jgi:hypothetical protein
LFNHERQLRHHGRLRRELTTGDGLRPCSVADTTTKVRAARVMINDPEVIRTRHRVLNGTSGNRGKRSEWMRKQWKQERMKFMMQTMKPATPSTELPPSTKLRKVVVGGSFVAFGVDRPAV